jgi:hypothetical protein
MKTISLTVLIAMFLAFAAEPSFAFRPAKGNASSKMSGRDYSGYGTKVACPVGACSMAGTSYATNIKNCSAANCRK